MKDDTPAPSERLSRDPRIDEHLKRIRALFTPKPALQGDQHPDAATVEKPPLPPPETLEQRAGEEYVRRKMREYIERANGTAKR